VTAFAQTRLALPIAGLEPISKDDANHLVVAWGHNLGPCRRPFGVDCWALIVGSNPVSVVIGASTVSEHVTDGAGGQFKRAAIVECARLCSDPANRWATRPMLRLWRECAAPLWPHWPVAAAVAYSQKRRHDGDIYRWDGWKLLSDNCGHSGGGGAWTRKRYASDEASGPKRLWGWTFAPEVAL
jgi:hypothetical protein